MFAALSLNEGVTLAGLAVLGVVAAGVAAYLTFGLFQSRSLIRRELAAYFTSPIAYVVFVVFLAVTGSLFAETLNKLMAKGSVGVEHPLEAMFDDNYFWLVFLAIPPLLTMRSFAEERASGTLEMLMTAPVRDWQVVLSKYVACFILYVLIWVPTLAYLPLLLGLNVTGTHLAVTPFSLFWVLWLAGLGVALVGLLMLIPRADTTLWVMALALLIGGTVVSCVGGQLHYARDTTHLIDINAGLDPAGTLFSLLGLAGLATALVGLVLLVPRLGTPLRVLSLSLLAGGVVAALVGGWLQADHEGTHLIDVSARFDSALTPFSILGLVGLATALVGLLLLILRVGKTLRIVSLALLLGGALVACVGGRLHYVNDRAYLLNVGIDPALTPFSVLGLAGLLAVLVGLVLLVPRLGTSLRVLSLLLLAGGAVVALIGGRLHYTLDSTHLFDLTVEAMHPELFSILGLAGLVAALIGLLLLIPRVSTTLRIVSLVLLIGGALLACVAGRYHYLYDHTHLIDVEAGLDPSAALTLYFGFLLAGAMFLALGLLVSSLVRDQLVAALIALALSLLFVVERFWRVDPDAGGAFDRFVYFFSVPLHFKKSFCLGLIDTRNVILYASVTVFCLFLTVRSLESRRWR
jgi:ABC-type transport system involved in multi-copper enzyme maturation permease subunit